MSLDWTKINRTHLLPPQGCEDSGKPGYIRDFFSGQGKPEKRVKVEKFCSDNTNIFFCAFLISLGINECTFGFSRFWIRISASWSEKSGQIADFWKSLEFWIFLTILFGKVWIFDIFLYFHQFLVYYHFLGHLTDLNYQNFSDLLEHKNTYFLFLFFVISILMIHLT